LTQAFFHERREGEFDPPDIEISDIALTDGRDRYLTGVGPFGQFVATSGNLVRLDSATNIPMAGQFLAFHGASPCRLQWKEEVTVVNETRSVAYRISCISNLREKELGAVKIPSDHKVFSNGPNRLQLSWQTVFCDHKRSRMLIIGLKTALVVPERTLLPKPEPVAFLDISGKKFSNPGETVRVVVQARAPGTKFEMVQAPEGIDLHDGVIEWTSREPVGRREFAFQVRLGDITFIQRWNHSVHQPRCQIPFRTARSKLSPDGKMLCLWEPELRHGATGVGITVVDTEKMMIVGGMKLDRTITDMEVLNDFILVPDTNKGAVDVYAAPSMKKLHTRFVGEKIELASLGNGKVVAFADSSQSRSAKLLSPPEFQLTDPPPAIQLQNPPVLFEGKWAIDDRVMDTNFEKILLRLRPKGTDPMSRFLQLRSERTAGRTVRWGRVLEHGAINTTGGDRIHLARGDKVVASVLMDEYPVIVAFSEAGVLSFHDLNTGEVVKSVTIPDQIRFQAKRGGSIRVSQRELRPFQGRDGSPATR
jgi:hypothetical protein